MKTVAVRNITRTDMKIVDGLAGHGVSTVHEAQGRSGLLLPYMRPVYPGARIAGNALTIMLQPGDNWMIHVAVELCRPGDVLVAGCTTPNTDGFFGDLLATSCRAHGVRGVVLEGGCRDIADLQAMGFPVWARAISSRGTVKDTPGAVNVPIICAGQPVFPGDVVVADDDGVCIVPRKMAAAALEAADARTQNEAEKRDRLANKELGLDIYGMRPKLEAAGLEYVDDLEALGEWCGIDCKGRG